MTQLSSQPRFSMVVAATPAGVIGDRGGMPWRLGSDLGRFKQITMGGTLIMGRKTFDSIGRPLPGRETIVVTRQIDWRHRGVHTADTRQIAVDLAASLDRPAFVVGGAEIYQLFMPLIAEIWLTVVWSGVSGDTAIEVPTAEFSLIETARFAQTAQDTAPTELQKWVRKKIRAKNSGPH